MPRPPGRPPGPLMPLEDLREHIPQMTALARRGGHPTLIAEAVGVHRTTWWRWVQHAKEGMEPYVTELQPILRARAMFLVEQAIKMAEDEKLLPAAWILERNEPGLFGMTAARYPDEDAPQQTTDTVGESVDRLKQLAAKYESSGAAKPAHLRLVDGGE